MSKTKIDGEHRCFREDDLDTYMDVSAWARIGKERGYWEYFKDEIIKEVDKKIGDLMHEDANTRLNERLSGWDILLKLRGNLK